MKNCVVITTINEPTEAIYKFATNPDWDLIIVGDKKTPHESYKDINCFYMSPEYQESNYKEMSDIIGWNKSPRRNLGFIEAYRRGAKVIALSDDDNIPYSFWGKNLLLNKAVEVDFYETTNMVFDPLFVTNHPYLWHRGYPLRDVSKRNAIYAGKKIITPLIQVDLWNEDPDIDAIGRMVYNPNITFDPQMAPFCSNTISPFDSQNTFISRELIKYFMLVLDVGRVDDIWGSYLLQKTYRQDNPYIVYSKASVYQHRNEHDLMDDFNLEIFGHNNLVPFLNDTHPQMNVYKQNLRLHSSYFE